MRKPETIASVTPRNESGIKIDEKEWWPGVVVPTPGFRCTNTASGFGGGLQCIEPLHQPTLLAGDGVLMHRALGSNAIQCADGM